MPRKSHPMHEAFYELATRTRGTSYAEVQAMIEDTTETEAGVPKIASFGLLRLPDGSTPRSHAVWRPGRGWLPEADLVSVVRADEERYVVVPRRVLVKHASHLLTRVPDVHPPYYAYDQVPDLELFEQLRSYAILEGGTRK